MFSSYEVLFRASYKKSEKVTSDSKSKTVDSDTTKDCYTDIFNNKKERVSVSYLNLYFAIF